MGLFRKKKVPEKPKETFQQKVQRKVTNAVKWIFILTIFYCVLYTKVFYPGSTIDRDALFDCMCGGAFCYVIFIVLYPILGFFGVISRKSRNTGGNRWNNDEVAAEEERRRNARQNEQRAAAERQRAANDAIYHQNQANANRGTYAGYQAQNRANDARNRSR